MANGQIHEQIASDVLSRFGMPLSVSAMTKVGQFPMLQKLGFNGQLDSMNSNFHGVKDFSTQLSMYSAAGGPLFTAAWNAIKGIAPKNPQVTSLLFSSPTLGSVGSLFQTIHNFDQVFAVSPNPLPSPSAIAAKVTS